MTAVDNKTRYQRSKAAGLCVSVARMWQQRTAPLKNADRISNKNLESFVIITVNKHECVDCGEKFRLITLMSGAKNVMKRTKSRNMQEEKSE